MTEVLFYHLTESTLEDALPPLVEKSLERGWTVVIEVGSDERLAALNAHLWTFREDSFIPHAAAGEGDGAAQPVYLTTGTETPNDASIRFHVDGTMPDAVEAYQRVVLLFDGHDNTQLDAARAAWKRLKASGHQLTYWQQTPEGRWEKKA